MCGSAFSKLKVAWLWQITCTTKPWEHCGALHLGNIVGHCTLGTLWGTAPWEHCGALHLGNTVGHCTLGTLWGTAPWEHCGALHLGNTVGHCTLGTLSPCAFVRRDSNF